MTTIQYNGCEYEWQAAVNLMDKELVEALYPEGCGMSEQQFFDLYVSAHAEMYGEEFVIN